MTASAYFDLSERLRHGISSALRWSELREVQERTIPAVLAGKNVLVLAPTAGGKTEAAFFPVLDTLHREPARGVGCVYVSPLRALLNNQEGRVKRLAGLVGLGAFKWHGDVGAGPRNRFLKEPAEVLMTTPESLEVLLTTGRDVEHALFAQTRFVVVDEIHAFAAGDRGAHLTAVLERLGRRSGEDLQRIGLSATVGNPEGLTRWLGGTSERPWEIVDPPRKPTQKRIAIHHVGAGVEAAASAAVPLAGGRKSIFFTQGRADTERVREALEGFGLPVFVHHSSVSREFREEAEGKFASSEGPATLVSTSTLELGIDVGDLDCVLQLDAPTTVSSFLQRLGRTGRRPGKAQHLEFFTSNEDGLLQAVALVNLARKRFVEKVEPSTENTPVLLHQILALVLEHAAIKREALWRSLKGPRPFDGIDRADFDGIVDHLIETGILRTLDGLVAFGEEGERVFGGKNFFELYSVFETPAEAVVKTPDGRVIGTLETDFVRKMEDRSLTFLLAGRTWQAVEVDLRRALVVAVPFSGGEAPRWHGTTGFLGRVVAEEMRAILLSEEAFRFVDEPGNEALRRLRKERAPILSRDRCPIAARGNGALRLHTYAGGKINATIAALAERSGLARVSGLGDLEIDLASPAGGQLEAESVRAMLRELRDAEASLSSMDLADLVGGTDRGRLAKFQPYLPGHLEALYLSRELLDIPGVAALARESDFPIV